MSFKILLNPKVAKDLKNLERHVLSRIDKALLDLSENPYPRNIKIIKDKKLAQCRVRIGDYRILYDVYVEDRVVYIIKIGHRKDVYR